MGEWSRSPAAKTVGTGSLVGVTAAVLGLLAGVGVAVDTGWWLTVDGWAALGQWVGGLGGLAAVVVALWLAHRDWQQAQAREADAARSRAFLVTSVCSKEEQGVVVVNHGPEPITQVIVPRLHGAERTIVANVVEFPPRQRALLLPGQGWTAPYPQSGEGLLDLGVHAQIVFADDDTEEVGAEVRWTDLSGTHWMRVGDGDPRQVVSTNWSASRPLAEVLDRDAVPPPVGEPPAAR